MTKYEIMLIASVSTKEETIKNFLIEVFKEEEIVSFEKMKNTEFAYPINKTTEGTYFLARVDTEPKNIAEFTRRSKLNREIIRQLVINLDSEVGLNRIIKPRPKRKYPPKPTFRKSGSTEGYKKYSYNKKSSYNNDAKKSTTNNDSKYKWQT